ncbi:MAG: NAD-dependent epimerase/dehydratase family protein [Deltaproteobacteria bacterium]|nr:NAD-dependent epimerase/dehydratase family protein [Deltaproteobacteria bacterium]
MRRLKVAVTGTLGVLGRHLLSRLDAEDACRQLVLLDLVPPPHPPRKACFCRVDLTEPRSSQRIADALERERVDVVVHLAFLQHPVRTAGYAHELEALGTQHLLNALSRLARGAAPVPLVVGSSTLVYGARPENPAQLREDAPLRGRPGYPLVGEKIAAERHVRAFQRASGTAVTILRMAPLLSPGVRTIVGRYLSLPAVPTLLGFNPMLQTLAVADAVEALGRALERAADGGGRGALEVYNVCGSDVLPLHAAIRLCGRRSVPLLRFAAGAMVDALFQAGLAIAPSAHFDYLQYGCVADGERAVAELGFVPRKSTRDCVNDLAHTLLRAAA